MHPQFTAWQAAPHSEVTCTQCHVGEGARALVRAKLAGTRRLFHDLTNQIQTDPGVADMRPALGPAAIVTGRAAILATSSRSSDGRGRRRQLGDRDDPAMFVGGPGRPTSSGRAIHWHADPDVRIEFVSTDHERQTIPYVRLVAKDGR